MSIFAPTNVKVTVDANKGLYQEAANTAEIVVNSDVPLTVESDMVQNGDLTVNGMTSLDKVSETYTSIVDATGVVVHNCASSHVFYHTSPDANWTVNLTNLDLANGFATSVTLVIVQGGTAYIPTAVQIAGAAQTLNWQGNVVPSGTPNRRDVVSFSILNVGGTYTVLGQLVSF